MKDIPISDLFRAPGGVLGDAQGQVVRLTRYKRPAFYLVSASDWERYFRVMAEAEGLTNDCD